LIVLNLKTYVQSLEKALLFTDVASDVVAESGIRIIICPPVIHLKEAADRFSNVFAQHVDAESAGAFTGSLPVDALKMIKVKGSLVSHSEKKLRPDKIKATVQALHSQALEALVCAGSPKEAAEVAAFEPTYIAVEPPELIGSGVSVSTAKPEVVTETVKAIKKINEKIPVLCGAGVSNKDDVRKALELGSDGVLLASAFVKAQDPKKFLAELASVF